MGSQRPWTLHEIADATRMRMDGLTTYSIARQLGRTETAVRSLLHRRGVTLCARITEDEVRFIRDNYRERGTDYCARRLRRSRETIKTYVCKHKDEIWTGGRDDRCET